MSTSRATAKADRPLNNRALPRRFGVHFDDVAWEEDLAATSSHGRAVATEARKRIERNGVLESELRACLDRGPRGTRLPDCVKLYMGEPDRHGPGNFGMVFAPTDDEDVLLFLAFGVRHMPPISRKPNVYQRADRRLNPR